MAAWRTVMAGLVAVGALAGPARAADPSPAPLKGEDVMGDKGRSGPDGWAQAPVTRDQGISAKAPGNENTPTPNKMPDPKQGRTIPLGEDPGAPAQAQSSGPGTLSTSAGDHKP